MAANFYANVSDVAVGETAINAVQSVAVNSGSTPLVKYGDGDIFPIEIRATKRTVTTNIVTDDINHGVSVGDKLHRVSFIAHKGDDQAQSVAIVVTGGVVGSGGLNAGHNSKGGSTIALSHRAADGTTNPLSIS